MNQSLAGVNPGVERDNLPLRRTRGSLPDYFEFTANNKFNIPAAEHQWGYQSKSFDCIGTKFEIDEDGVFELRYGRAQEAKHHEHSVTRAISRGDFTTDQLVLEGLDAYRNERTFVVRVKNNRVVMVIEDGAIIYAREDGLLTRLWKSLISR